MAWLLRLVMYRFLYVTMFTATTIAAGHWSYDPESVANEWPQLCRTGDAQSPVHLVTRLAKSMTVSEKEYPRPVIPDEITATIESWNPELVLRFKGPKSRKSKNYVLTHIRFRWPAEHQLDDELADLELQYIYQKANSIDKESDERVRAYSFLYVADSDADNPFLAPIIKAVAASVKKGKGTSVSTDFEELVACRNSELSIVPPQWFQYTGSETSPDCREVVDWWVYRDYGEVSPGQIQTLVTATGITEARRPFVDNSDQREYTVYNTY